MSFLCGFGKKKKSRKEEPYTKPSQTKPGPRDKPGKSDGREGGQQQERPRKASDPSHTQPKPSHHHPNPSHTQPKPPEKETETTRGNLKVNQNQSTDNSLMTSSKRNQTGDLQNGGPGVINSQDKTPTQETRIAETATKSEVDGNYNHKKYKVQTEESVFIHSYQEAEDIERLSEHIMSGEKITSADIVGKRHNIAPTEDRLGTVHKPSPDSHYVPGAPKMTEPSKPGKEKEYITVDQMGDYDLYYRMNHKRRGMCLIVNVGEFHPSTRMQNRAGYLVDGELMKGTFTRLGFNVTYLKNPKNNDLKRKLEEASLANHQDVDCFAMVIMTHGNRDYGDVIFTKDGIMHLDFIIEYFNGLNCPQLAGKPKLFFVQACRGDKLDQGLPYIDDDYDEVDAAAAVAKIPIEADILLSQATSPGYISFRNSQKGSIYIRCLTKALSEHADSEDLLSILTRVNAMVAFEFESNSSSRPEFSGKKQMPTFTCQLTKRLQFKLPKGV